MARVVKELEYAERRHQIIDTAQKLVYTKGYEQMSIQDILDDLKISKGAFYHYFGSKQALLEALIVHLEDEGELIVNPIIQNGRLSAIEKLQAFFDSLNNWKLAHKTYLMALTKVLYSDDNAIFRQKLITAGIQRFTPLLTQIIHEGQQEGILRPDYPDQAGEVVWALLHNLGDTVVYWLLDRKPDCDGLEHITKLVAAYTAAMECMLGAPPGSIKLIDEALLSEWATDD
jgi:AcrR family transcriptional regulator